MIKLLSKLLVWWIKPKWQNRVCYRVGLNTAPFRIALNDSYLDLIFNSDVILRLRKIEFAKHETPLSEAIRLLQKESSKLKLTLSFEISELQSAIEEYLK
jgi:hypothetical protein